MTTPDTQNAEISDAELAGRLHMAVHRAEEHAGTVPAKDAVKLVPADWHRVADLARTASASLSRRAEASAPAPEGLAYYRHRKGGEYVLLGYGKMQAEDWRDVRNVALWGSSSPWEGVKAVDMREVAIYRSVKDGSLWARPREEFEDGRFELIASPSPSPTPAEPGVTDETCALCGFRIVALDELEFDADGEAMHRGCRKMATTDMLARGMTTVGAEPAAYLIHIPDYDDQLSFDGDLGEGDIRAGITATPLVRAALTAAPAEASEPSRESEVVELAAQLRGPVLDAAQRLIRGAFRRDGEHLPDDQRPRFTIPARLSNDDVIVVEAILAASSALSRAANPSPEPAAVGAVRAADVALAFRAAGLLSPDATFAQGPARDFVSAIRGLASPPTPEPEPTEAARHGIYIASKTAHASRWRVLRDTVGEPIISTWIDEAGEGESGDLADLWRRCIAEASNAEILILYREPGEVLKGGWVELGAALACGVRVFAIGVEEFTVAKHAGIEHFPDMKSAIAAARAARQAVKP